MGNNLGPFLEAPDRTEGQELGGGAVGGGIIWDHFLVTKPMFWDMGNHLRSFSEAPNRPEGQELGGGTVGGQDVLQEVKFQLSF